MLIIRGSTMAETSLWMKKENTGAWNVLDSYIITPKGEKKYLCRCDCGTERYVLERSLRYGGSQSCGCLTYKRVSERLTHRLEGRVFGELSVLGPSQTEHTYGGVWWVCECSCGGRIELPGTRLVTGRVTHCGCQTERRGRFHDITGQSFRMLTVQYRTERRKGPVMWHCLCECGKEVDVSYNDLMYSHRVSCGCKRAEHEKSLPQFLTHVNGTSLDMISSTKLPSDNTTGYKGVYRIRGKFVAKIVFQHKAYHLGTYEEIEKAAEARREAEELLFAGAVAHYQKWKERAATDRAWGEKNPIQMIVTKGCESKLSVTFLPAL